MTPGREMETASQPRPWRVSVTSGVMPPGSLQGASISPCRQLVAGSRGPVGSPTPSHLMAQQHSQQGARASPQSQSTDRTVLTASPYYPQPPQVVHSTGISPLTASRTPDVAAVNGAPTSPMRPISAPGGARVWCGEVATPVAGVAAAPNRMMPAFGALKREAATSCRQQQQVDSNLRYDPSPTSSTQRYTPVGAAADRDVSTTSMVRIQSPPVQEEADEVCILSPQQSALARVGRTSLEERPAGVSSLDKSSSENDASAGRKRPASKLKLRRRNILSLPTILGGEELKSQRRADLYGGGSSSDENRSSGHASMSESHTSSSPPAETLPRHEHYRSPLRTVPEDSRTSVGVAVTTAPASSQALPRTARPVPLRPTRLRPKDDLSLPASSGLEDIKQAIAQLTLRSQSSRTSYSTSTYSSQSGSESEPARRLARHSSLETINTNVTAADEFVWLDSHNRLVELQKLPWSNHDILRLVQNGRLREHMERVAMETIPRLSYLLQRALVRVAREAQRLARAHDMCTKQEVLSALRIVLAPALSDSCAKSCMRAAAMYSVSGAEHVKQSKSGRAGLHLSVGRFHRWMCDVRLGKFIHDYGAVYLTAGMENLLEEVVLACLPEDSSDMLTASALEHRVAGSGDLWGLFQPHAHLNSGRTASGALALPRFPSSLSVDSVGLAQTCQPNNQNQFGSSAAVTSSDEQRTGRTVQQALLTTCVGSLSHLSELLTGGCQYLHCLSDSSCRAKQPLTWSAPAQTTLFYFMRCSQLEHAQCTSHAHRRPVQELVFERPYIVLPPIVEWVRTASAHALHRRSPSIDKDDVMQAARLLLPGVDCAPRTLWYDDAMCSSRYSDETECARRFKVDLAFRMLNCGRPDLTAHALHLLPSKKGELPVDARNEAGLTPLMVACMRGDEQLTKTLLDSGADLNTETPPPGPHTPTVNPETQHWTALTYATMSGHAHIMRVLLERGANVEGGARINEDKCTETPLQVAAASGSVESVSLLLNYCARPFLSTLLNDSLCYSAAAQKGCYSAIAVAAVHGQREVLHRLLSHPLNATGPEVLSLAEILAEGSGQSSGERRANRLQVLPVSVDDPRTSSLGCRSSETSQMVKLTKSQIKTLQEAMYHSAESRHLEITLDLRNLGVPWTLHCWMTTLATAYECRLENIIDQLLQDFLQVWPDDYSSQFVDECLPLLFNIFRYSKNEGTSLLLADIFSCCFGRDPIRDIRESSTAGGPRIDPKFVNSAELSDAQFRVEGRVFYAHKIILVNASQRFRQMLSARLPDGNAPVVQINDIRYDIFQMVMHFLYKGGCDELSVSQADVLELMAAANFFQLDGLLRHCEVRCSRLVDLDNIVSMYIHAKVYNAVELLEFCQGFLLQNMVALLTYDDSVRRLMLGRRLHNHDVLTGLLATLQKRCHSRSGTPARHS